MRVLIIHQNFPGQFRHAATEWSKRPGWQVVGVGRDTAPGIAGVPCLRYRPHRNPRRDQHPYLRTMESAVLHGQAVLRILVKLKRDGFVPDAILAHPGWGETLYAKEVFPKARLVHFCEWYYGTEGSDLGFDPQFPATLDDLVRVKTWNALHLLNLENCDVGVTPTEWQHSRHPEIYRSKIIVAHEGIDVERLGPDREASFVVPSGQTKGLELRRGDPVVTYVARNLEPYRGFHQFLAALEMLQRERPDCHAVIVGGDDVSYGRRPKDAATWREALLKNVSLDFKRTHFVGKLPYEQYLKVLQISSAHVYLTYPFVLSWSLLEAMASGCAIVGSDTPPVREVVVDGINGLLAPFFNSLAIAEKVLHSLEQGQQTERLRGAAREFVRQNFSHTSGLSKYERLLAQSLSD